MEAGPAEEAAPASNVERILAALSEQATAIQRHDQALSEILCLLNPHSQTTMAQVATSPSAPLPTPEPKLPPPQRFDGSPENCRGFITQCTLIFQLQPSCFPTDSSKVAYIITLLTGKALDWASALWDKESPITSNFQCFLAEMKRVFLHSADRGEAGRRLLRLSQGSRSAAEFAIEFRTLATESGWDEHALRAIFHHALSPKLKDELAFRDSPSDLESLIDLAIRVDHRLKERQTERQQETVTARPDNIVYPTLDPEEPMQLGTTRITPSERTRRMRERCCIYCGRPGHFRATCPELSGKVQSRSGVGAPGRE
ncbi:Retrotransposon-derived PEG10 [Labeo rohita]|uniref:Retrotransposon-derived PEG10 n=1 Tax=Labeo rohita TaxID=84645 RepID=A0A498LCN1_LABRO|nr:Retrotransposon-derived PEG10 [Labeo rohita]